MSTETRAFEQLLLNALNARNTQPITVTQEQHDALEALVVMYMTASAAREGGDVPAEIAEHVIGELDQVWDRLLAVVKTEGAE